MNTQNLHVKTKSFLRQRNEMFLNVRVIQLTLKPTELAFHLLIKLKAERDTNKQQVKSSKALAKHPKGQKLSFC